MTHDVFFPMKIETRAASDGGLVLEGHAFEWGKSALIRRGRRPGGGGAWREQFQPGAFADVLDDVGLAIQHRGDTLYLARTTNGSMSVEEDAKGLAYRASLDHGDAEHVLVHRRVASGIPGGVSVTFGAYPRNRKQEILPNGDILETITKVDLFPDISIVNRPAYASSIEARYQDMLNSLPVSLQERRRGILMETERELPPRARALRAKSLSRKAIR